MIETVFSWDTKLSADTVEWCPNKGYEHFFALGTYQVEKDDQKDSFTDDQRYGKLYLFEDKSDQVGFQLVDEIETRAILDMKWSSSSLVMVPSYKIQVELASLGSIQFQTNFMITI